MSSLVSAGVVRIPVQRQVASVRGDVHVHADAVIRLGVQGIEGAGRRGKGDRTARIQRGRAGDVVAVGGRDAIHRDAASGLQGQAGGGDQLQFGTEIRPTLVPPKPMPVPSESMIVVLATPELIVPLKATSSARRSELGCLPC